jgi:hypothetical protein
MKLIYAQSYSNCSQGKIFGNPLRSELPYLLLQDIRFENLKLIVHIVMSFCDLICNINYTILNRLNHILNV